MFGFIDKVVSTIIDTTIGGDDSLWSDERIDLEERHQRNLQEERSEFQKLKKAREDYNRRRAEYRRRH